MKNYLEVLINKHIFTYECEQEVAIGQEVLVPFRNRRASGYVVGLVEKPEFATKPIIDIVRPKPQYSKELTDLANWIADYYYCYRTKAFELILPR
jgi:primosomal protein N' (replication factor Y)